MSTETLESKTPAGVDREFAAYLAPFEPWLQEAQRAGGETMPDWLVAIRRTGAARFAEVGFPTLADEDWRFTNLAPVIQLPFAPVFAPPSGVSAANALADLEFGELPGSRLVFVDGHWSSVLSRVNGTGAGWKCGSLRQALAGGESSLRRHLAAGARADGPAFQALNAAYFQDGGWIEVGAGVRVEEPIQLVYVSTGRHAGAASHPRNLILAAAGSRLTVIEHYVGLGEASGLTNTVTELVAGEEAEVEHVRYQNERRTTVHIGTLAASLGRASRVLAHSFALGAALARQHLNLTLQGEGIECVLNGLYLTEGDQLSDHHMVVDHAQPNCTSHEYFNGILANRSRGVFHGRILVRPGAQKTDAKQTNKNLLLSDEATVNTKPQLEIYADDVKCTHGATVGQLNPESVFYLRSRGIPLDTARRMLIHAFAGEIIDRVRYGPLRQALDRLIWDRLDRDDAAHLGRL